MSDYINYRNSNEIKLANLAYELGDYRCAMKYYSKALNRLKNYQGDRVQSIMTKSELAQKIKKLNELDSKGKSILRFDTWDLTKSSFVKGSQCVKYLYLDKHKKTERTPVSEEKQILFEKGRSFEKFVRESEFPDGKNIKEIVGNFAYLNSYTKQLLTVKGRQILYEATIIENTILVMCDVLIKNNDESLDIYEIKLSTKLNDAILNDLSVQYFVCKKRFGDKLNSFNVILRSDEAGKKWSILNLKSELENKLKDVESKIKTFKAVLRETEPVVPMGKQCSHPYECEFIEYCKKIG